MKLTIRVSDDTGDLGLAASTNLAVKPLNEVETTSPEFPSPAEITNAVLPILISGEWRNGISCVADKAADGVGVQAEEERDKQVMSVPEGFEALLSNLNVGSGVHEKHAEEHDVASNTTGLLVVDIKCETWTKLGSLDVEEAEAKLAPWFGQRRGVAKRYILDIMSGGVNYSEEEGGVGKLTVEPQILIEGQPSNLGADPSHNRTAHGQQDKHAVETENKPSTSRDPDGELQ